VIRVESSLSAATRCSTSRSGALVSRFAQYSFIPRWDGSTPKARFADLDVSGEAPRLSSHRAHRDLLLLNVGRVVVAHSLLAREKPICSFLWVLCHRFRFHPVLQLPFWRRRSHIGRSTLGPRLPSSFLSTRYHRSYGNRNRTLSLSQRMHVSTYVNLDKPIVDDSSSGWMMSVSCRTNFQAKVERFRFGTWSQQELCLLGSHYFAQSSWERVGVLSQTRG